MSEVPLKGAGVDRVVGGLLGYPPEPDISLPNNQSQHRISHAPKDVLPVRLCASDYVPCFNGSLSLSLPLPLSPSPSPSLPLSLSLSLPLPPALSPSLPPSLSLHAPLSRSGEKGVTAWSEACLGIRH